ncbi:MAG: DUF1998 domain-containing protein [Capsulimonas sp.]|uniref:DUF1998 domain-containing protein n=1 Tax=Capsulimonas sp. TaxID=2494211 RepID=UPI0032644FB8
MRAHGQIRRSQVITTFGPGALIDLPKHSGIVGGLDTWPNLSQLEEIVEPRLSQKLSLLTDIPSPRLYAPPADASEPGQTPPNIGVWRFPEVFVVQEQENREERSRSRRLVHRRALDDRGKFDGLPVVATRFLRACPKGHVDDLDWFEFVHGQDAACRKPVELWLDEKGTSGDLSDLSVRCKSCGKSRKLIDATYSESDLLGNCKGRRPWLGLNTNEPCHYKSKLLIRTASNAYFPQVFSVLSLPDRGSEVEQSVQELWQDLQVVEDDGDLRTMKKKKHIADALKPFADVDILEAIESIKNKGAADDRPVKHAELAAILAVPEGYGDDVPIDENFHARRLPESAWRHNPEYSAGIESVIQLHRLREVIALIGFTRFEAITPDITGEYEDNDVERASIAIEPAWFPAIENRGEGVFIQLRAKAIDEWLERDGVKRRISALAAGHKLWAMDRNIERGFPGGPYVLLHTLSHLLVQSLAMKCGYPASSIRERIYANGESRQYGVLLYTGSSDAEGTLGGLVQQARYVEEHLMDALRTAALCSNDPICSEHKPGASMEKRWLQGASCHGCALLAETSCEMRNDYLDRALVVPVLGNSEAAFFRPVL